MTYLDRAVDDIRGYYPKRTTTIVAAREFAARELEDVAFDLLFLARTCANLAGRNGRNLVRTMTYMHAVKLLRARAREIRE